MKHTLKYALPALCAAVLCLSGSALSASAYTADDVAAKARAAGWPEYLIQQGYNEWQSGEYTQAQLDKAYASVTQYNDQTGEKIANALDVDFVPGSPTTEAPTQQAVTEAPAQAAADTPAAAETPAQPAPAAPLTVTKSDGTTEERVTKADFINMTIEDKKAYVASLSEDSKKDFMNSLSVEERNSIIKQLPAEEKAEIIQSYVDTAKDMGMNVAVDNISDNNVSMTIRNEDGQVIGKTAVGTIIDETGISHTSQLLTALLAAVISVLGFTLIYRYLSRMD